jgi:hypothetical protein
MWPVNLDGWEEEEPNKDCPRKLSPVGQVKAEIVTTFTTRVRYLPSSREETQDQVFLCLHQSEPGEDSPRGLEDHLSPNPTPQTF